MPEVTVYSADGAAGPGLALEDTIFGAEVRADLVHAAVVAHLAGKRLGTHAARTRGEVVGGGRKPYRQKGTGRARQGSVSAPQYRGGGVVFPPKPRDYHVRLPRRVRRAAMASAWSAHVADGSLRVVAGFELDELKTARAAAALRVLLQPLADQAVADAPAPRERDEEDTRPVRRVKVRRHALVLLGPDELEQRRAFRNLAELRFDSADKVSVIFTVRNVVAPYATVYDLTLADAVVATQAAIARVTAEFTAAEDDEEVPA